MNEKCRRTTSVPVARPLYFRHILSFFREKDKSDFESARLREGGFRCKFLRTETRGLFRLKMSQNRRVTDQKIFLQSYLSSPALLLPPFFDIARLEFQQFLQVITQRRHQNVFFGCGNGQIVAALFD